MRTFDKYYFFTSFLPTIFGFHADVQMGSQLETLDPCPDGIAFLKTAHSVFEPKVTLARLESHFI